jgi:hypothetical protein
MNSYIDLKNNSPDSIKNKMTFGQDGTYKSPMNKYK